jgi:hypothetical protein
MFCYLQMDDHNKPSRRKPAKTSLPSILEKEAMTTALNAKLPKSVQPAPLEPAKVYAPPVKDMGMPAPSFDATSNVAASGNMAYSDKGYDYRDYYGGNQPTRYNSSQVDDCKHHARAEFRYQQATRRPTPTPGYVDAYSAPYSDQYAYGQGLCPFFEAPQRESQALPALNRMERILDRFGGQLQSFLGQGELIFYILLKFLKFTLLPCKCFSWSPLLGLYSLERSWAATGFTAARPESCPGPHACSKV